MDEQKCSEQESGFHLPFYQGVGVFESSHDTESLKQNDICINSGSIC